MSTANQSDELGQSFRRLGLHISGVTTDPENTILSVLRRVGLFLALTTLASATIAYFTNDRLAVFIFFGLVTPFLLVLVPAVRKRLSFMLLLARTSRSFAICNDFVYHDEAKPDFPANFEPSIAKTGLFEKREQIISGNFQGYPFESYIYTTRHPFAYRFSRLATRVYVLQLPKLYPHIFLATRRPAGAKHATSFHRHFADDQRMQLEGNFEDLFTSYTHRRTNTDARVILAPNVMQTIIDTNRNYNIEILGNRLYLYSPDYYPTPENFIEGFTIFQAVAKHFDRLNRTMKFTLPNDKKYPFLRSQMGFGTANIGGKYFNKSILFIMFYILYSLGRLALTDKKDKLVFRAQIAVIVVSTIVMIVALLVFRRKYKHSL